MWPVAGYDRWVCARVYMCVLARLHSHPHDGAEEQLRVSRDEQKSSRWREQYIPRSWRKHMAYTLSPFIPRSPEIVNPKSLQLKYWILHGGLAKLTQVSRMDTGFRFEEVQIQSCKLP